MLPLVREPILSLYFIILWCCIVSFFFLNVLLAFIIFLIFSGARTVVHPKARIIAEAGPIVIGEGNLIEEQVLIINRYSRYFHVRQLFFFFFSGCCVLLLQLSREHQTRHGGSGAQTHDHRDQ